MSLSHPKSISGRRPGARAPAAAVFELRARNHINRTALTGVLNELHCREYQGRILITEHQECGSRRRL